MLPATATPPGLFCRQKSARQLACCPCALLCQQRSAARTIDRGRVQMPRIDAGASSRYSTAILDAVLCIHADVSTALSCLHVAAPLSWLCRHTALTMMRLQAGQRRPVC